MADPRTTAGNLARELGAMFGDELWSVVLFGSVPRGEAIPGISDLNILVLLETVGATQLGSAAPLVRQWVRAGNAPPHIYSWNEWLGMQDTFAIEIADMHDAREVLLGTDPIAGHAPKSGDLRLHAERETRDTLLNLRLRLMLSGANPAEVGSLLISGLPSFTAYMRAALRLNGEEPGRESRAVIERTARLTGADPEALLTCWDARTNLRGLKARISDPLVETYTEFVQGLTEFLDAFPVTMPPAVAAGPSAGAHGPARL